MRVHVRVRWCVCVCGGAYEVVEVDAGEEPLLRILVVQHLEDKLEGIGHRVDGRAGERAQLQLGHAHLALGVARVHFPQDLHQCAQLLLVEALEHAHDTHDTHNGGMSDGQKRNGRSHGYQ